MNSQQNTPPFSYNFATGFMNWFSLLAFIGGSILLICTLLNIPPYIDFGDGLIIGFGDYKYGIPVEGRVLTDIPDISIARFDGKERTVTNVYLDSTKEELKQPFTGLANYTDTIRVQYTNRIRASLAGQTIHAARIDYMTFFLQPSNFFQKFLLSFPFILELFIIGFCCLQITKILDNIQDGNAFTDTNYTRMINIAWLIIGFQVLMFLIDLIQDFTFGTLIVDFISSMPNYRTPLELNAAVESDFNMRWLVIGAMLLVIARTFKDGQKLQKEKELTV